MSKLKMVFGFIWAAVAVLAIPAVFMANNSLAEKLVRVSAMKISPLYTGGEVFKAIDNKDYTTIIHEPVFVCLAGETGRGFIQIVWRRKNEKPLPRKIIENINIDGGLKINFIFEFDAESQSVSFKQSSDAVIGLLKVYTLKNGFAVRIGLKKERPVTAVNKI